jgi:plastocyanin
MIPAAPESNDRRTAGIGVPARLAFLLAATASLFALPAHAGNDIGSLSGHVRFEGTPPPRPKITMTADPACDKLYPDGQHAEMLVVDPSTSGLANVLVYVKSGLDKDYRAPAPSGTVLVDQKRCAYVPHVVGVRVGQEVEFRNSDQTLHNVNARTYANTPFNQAMFGAGSTLTKTFQAPEVAVKLKCDIHPWMAAYVGVFEHPFFAVTAGDGSFSIPGLPEGEYVIEAWHESLGTRSAKVEIEDGKVSKADFSFAGN